MNHLAPLALSRDVIELFDLRSDPGETTNVASSKPEVRDAILAELKRIRSDLDARGVPDFDPGDAPGEMRLQLQALGYVVGGIVLSFLG